VSAEIKLVLNNPLKRVGGDWERGRHGVYCGDEVLVALGVFVYGESLGLRR